MSERFKSAEATGGDAADDRASSEFPDLSSHARRAGPLAPMQHEVTGSAALASCHVLLAENPEGEAQDASRVRGRIEKVLQVPGAHTSQSCHRLQDPRIADQAVFNQIGIDSKGWPPLIFPLSEQLFADGMLAKALTVQHEQIDGMLLRPSEPIILHANHTLGLENKRRLLKMTGNWLVE